MQAESSFNARRTSGTSAPELSHGNTYGDTFFGSRAVAQLGDSYTSLHIHIENCKRSPTPEPLTVSETIGVIKEGNEKLVHVIRTIAGISGGSQVLTELQIELSSTSIVLSGLENFLRCTESVAPSRAALIPVQDLISVITQLALVYSELQVIVKQWEGPQQSILQRFRESWKSRGSTITKLQDRLQRHKLSLSLILQIIQCGEHFDAEHIATALRSKTDRELEENVDLAKRIQEVELPPNTAILNDDSHTLDPENIDETLAEPETPQEIQTLEACKPQTVIPYLEAERLESFNEITALSWVYRRVREFEIDAFTTSSTTRSRGWSALSGISSARLSTVGIIGLPLRQSESERLLALKSLQMTSKSFNEVHGDPKPTLIDLEQILNESLLYQERGISMKTYMSGYTKVHNYCTSLKPSSEFSYRFNGVQGAHTLGAEIYTLLSVFLSNHLEQLSAIAETYTDEALLAFYVREWDRHTIAAKYNNLMFKYMNRHWVKREMDEGNRGVYETYTLHLVKWESDFLDKVGAKVTEALLQSVKKLRDGRIVETLSFKAVIDSFISFDLEQIHGTASVNSPRPVYERYFQQPFLVATRKYYRQCSERLIAVNSMSKYMKEVELKLNDEKQRIGRLLRPETVEKLMDQCNRALITDHIVLLQAEFRSMLDKECNEDLARMYKLLSRTKDGLGPLKDRFDAFLQKLDLEQHDE